MSYRILVMGGYGNFGQRICRELVKEANTALIIAGRSRQRADDFINTLNAGNVSAARIDLAIPGWQAAILKQQPDLLIHTCGPFQGQGYALAEHCIRNGIHYLDLADGREFVTGFGQLDSLARQHGVCAISGASTVPALSAAVIDALLPDFAQVDSIDHGINPGNQTPRGLATVRSILSYCGRPFLQWRDGQWQTAYGWQGLVRRHYPPPMGTRCLSYCDIPDLALLPARYPGVRSVVFRAGLELPLLHIGTWLLSWLSRWRLVDNWASYARSLTTASECFSRFGSTRGGMHVEITGRDHAGNSLQSRWYLLADGGDGPQVPCTSAVILARKFIRHEMCAVGAMPCMGLFTLDEFVHALSQYNIRTFIERGHPDGAEPLTNSCPL